MTKRKLLLAIAFVAAIAVMMPSTSYAQGHAVGRSGGGHVVTGGARGVTGPVAPGHAVPRPPYTVGHYPYHPYYPYYPYYRPYYYGYPGFSLGFGLGFYYGYPYAYGYYPYAYGYPYYPSAPYGYAYPAYPGYAYPYPYPNGSVGVEPGGAPGGTQGSVASGGIRITDAPKNADVFVDGNYVGKVDDFDGTFQHLNLEPGSHHIEVRAQGYETLGFDVRIDPGQTINYRARMRQVQ